MNFANVDVIIAKNNINRYNETKQIDMVYLKGLSYDAVPEMQNLLASVKDLSDKGERQIAEDIIEYFEDKKVSHNEVEKYLRNLREPAKVVNVYLGK